jgi:hypothetical protein
MPKCLLPSCNQSFDQKTKVSKSFCQTNCRVKYHRAANKQREAQQRETIKEQVGQLKNADQHVKEALAKKEHFADQLKKTKEAHEQLEQFVNISDAIHLPEYSFLFVKARDWDGEYCECGQSRAKAGSFHPDPTKRQLTHWPLKYHDVQNAYYNAVVDTKLKEQAKTAPRKKGAIASKKRKLSTEEGKKAEIWKQYVAAETKTMSNPTTNTISLKQFLVLPGSPTLEWGPRLFSPLTTPKVAKRKEAKAKSKKQQQRQLEEFIVLSQFVQTLVDNLTPLLNGFDPLLGIKPNAANMFFIWAFLFLRKSASPPHFDTTKPGDMFHFKWMTKEANSALVHHSFADALGFTIPVTIFAKHNAAGEDVSRALTSTPKYFWSAVESYLGRFLHWAVVEEVWDTAEHRAYVMNLHDEYFRNEVLAPPVAFQGKSSLGEPSVRSWKRLKTVHNVPNHFHELPAGDAYVIKARTIHFVINPGFGISVACENWFKDLHPEMKA